MLGYHLPCASTGVLCCNAPPYDTVLHAEGGPTCVGMVLLRSTGVENIVKEVESIRLAAQNEMLLSEDSSSAVVLEELQQLQTQLQAHSEELARLHGFQRLFKVRSRWLQAPADA